jgi:hypothetical protein
MMENPKKVESKSSVTGEELDNVALATNGFMTKLLMAMIR